MPKISIIVPVYQVEKYIHRCINSIVAQTFTDFELILVVDGSLDNCGKICDEYAAKDNRIHIIHKKNGGLSDARNKGLDWTFEHSNSEWITFIDSDDWVHKNYLKYLYSIATDNNNIVACAYKKTTKNETDCDCKLEYINIEIENYYCNYRDVVIACCKLYKKNLFQNIRYPAGKLHEDEYTTYKLLFQSSHISIIQFPLYYYFFNESSITNSKWSPRRLDSLEALRDQIKYFSENGFNSAHKRSVFNAAMNVSKNYIQIENSDYIPNKDWYISLLRREMKRILNGYGSKEVLPFSEYKFVYEIAHPHLMKLYWRIQSIKSKLKRG